jgi:4a-hydroxytetrahydrobiopterin dehydratase
MDASHTRPLGTHCAKPAIASMPGWRRLRRSPGWLTDAMRYTRISAEEFDLLDGLDDWRYMLGGIRACFRAGSFAAAAELAVRIAHAADAADHHPDVDLRYPDRVMVSLTTHDVSGLTTTDVELARTLSSIAASAGAPSESLMSSSVEFAIDTTDADRIRPFWKAVLGYRESDGVLVDPLRMGPPLWFQHTDVPRAGRGRFHVDVTVPHDVAEQRVAAAITAGGTLVTDRFARSWWVLADADGNEACVCTWQDRSNLPPLSVG